MIEIGEGGGTRTHGVPLVACGADDGGERGTVGGACREFVEDVAEGAREDTLDPSDLFNVRSFSHSKRPIRSAKKQEARVRCELRAAKQTQRDAQHTHTAQPHPHAPCRPSRRGP